MVGTHPRDRERAELQVNYCTESSVTNENKQRAQVILEGILGYDLKTFDTIARGTFNFAIGEIGKGFTLEELLRGEKIGDADDKEFQSTDVETLRAFTERSMDISPDRLMVALAYTGQTMYHHLMNEFVGAVLSDQWNGNNTEFQYLDNMAASDLKENRKLDEYRQKLSRINLESSKGQHQARELYQAVKNTTIEEQTALVACIIQERRTQRAMRPIEVRRTNEDLLQTMNEGADTNYKPQSLERKNRRGLLAAGLLALLATGTVITEYTIGVKNFLYSANQTALDAGFVINPKVQADETPKKNNYEKSVPQKIEGPKIEPEQGEYRLHKEPRIDALHINSEKLEGRYRTIDRNPKN